MITGITLTASKPYATAAVYVSRGTACHCYPTFGGRYWQPSQNAGISPASLARIQRAQLALLARQPK